MQGNDVGSRASTRRGKHGSRDNSSAGHVCLHAPHAVIVLEGDASRVKSDALAGKGQGRPVASCEIFDHE
jgi:hypothetical protein